MATNVRNVSFGNATKVPSAPLGTNWAAKGTEAYTKLATAFQGKTGVIVAFTLLLLAFLLVIVYILRELRSNSYKKGKLITRGIINVSAMETPVEIPSTDLPKKSIGDQTSYSFWMYLDGFQQTPGYHKLVFYRGEKDSVISANPVVMLDEVANKLHFVIKTRESSLSAVDSSIKYNDLKPIVSRNYFMNSEYTLDSTDTNKHLIMTIQNVPYNRWAHYAIGIKDNIVTLFQDGEIYAVKTVDDFIQMKPMEYDLRGQAKKYNLTIDDSNGTVFIGKNENVGGKNSINGYISKMEAFNYAVSVEDVKALYNRKPSSIGLAGTAYGIRSPVYKLTTVA
jgi:hypothetical protein